MSNSDAGRLGDYRVVRLLATGGMAQVFLARDGAVDHSVELEPVSQTWVTQMLTRRDLPQHRAA
jgi:hypothetical protein